MAQEEAKEFQSIGEVLVALKPEFPDVTISKIRFLEGEGLIDPERTSSGYRKFYEKDVRRIRQILKLQRDEYLPLKVIRERLDGDATDGAAAVAAPTAQNPLPAQAAEPEDEEPAPNLRMNADDLAAAAGTGTDAVEALASFGLLRPQQVGGERTFDGDDLLVLRVAKEFFRFGVEPRHLTMYKHFAEREATFFQQIVVPVLRQRNPEARKQAAQTLSELARQSRRMKQALLRANLRRLLSS